MFRLKPAVYLVFAMVLLASLTEPAAAELLVIVADGVDVPLGAELPDDHVFDVPDNGKLIIVDLTDKVSFWMGGPYKGTLANYFAECRAASGPSKLCSAAGR